MTIAPRKPYWPPSPFQVAANNSPGLGTSLVVAGVVTALRFGMGLSSVAIEVLQHLVPRLDGLLGQSSELAGPCSRPQFLGDLVVEDQSIGAGDFLHDLVLETVLAPLSPDEYQVMSNNNIRDTIDLAEYGLVQRGPCRIAVILVRALNAKTPWCVVLLL